jgi:glycosyltransferase involved in cell wall biosynthesis
MRVAHLTTVDMSLELLLRPQLLAIIDAGGEAIGISARGPWVEVLERSGIRHVALASSTRGFDLRADLRSVFELWRALRRVRPDVLHTHNPKPGLYGRVVGRLARVPIVVNTVHGLYATEDDPWPKRALVYSLEAIAARCSDAEFIQNPEDLALMTRLHITPSERAHLLGNGVDLTRFDPTRFSVADRGAVRTELGIADDEILVGAVGRLVAEKGYPELFRAMESLPARFRLVVVGADDPEKADALPRELLEAARDRGVVFLGHRGDIDALYPAMDMFVLASHREGFPRAAMEAAAMRVPIVATDIRGCRQVVDEDVNGLLVPPRDARALAVAIRQLGDDPRRRSSFGLEGRRIAQERFDERRCVAIVMQTYNDIARRKGIALV